jgi:hypothetical protein
MTSSKNSAPSTPAWIAYPSSSAPPPRTSSPPTKQPASSLTAPPPKKTPKPPEHRSPHSRLMKRFIHRLFTFLQKNFCGNLMHFPNGDTDDSPRKAWLCKHRSRFTSPRKKPLAAPRSEASEKYPTAPALFHARLLLHSTILGSNATISPTLLRF